MDRAAHAALQQAKVRSKLAALPDRSDDWALTSLRQRLLEMGGQLVKDVRYFLSGIHQAANS